MLNWSQVDPALPAVAQVLNPSAAAALFACQWSAAHGMDSTAVTIQTCQLQGLHYQPAQRCTAVYHLLVTPLAQPPRPTIGVVEAGASGCTTRLYQGDTHLPWLTEATDGERLLERFRAIYPGVTAVQVFPVRYKPNDRCVVRYRVETATGQQICFGKTLARNADRLADVLMALARAGEAYPALPQVPQPLAYWADLHLVLQSAVAGQELHHLLFDPTVAVAQRLAWVAQVGQAVAALHSLDSIAAPGRTDRDELAELRAYLPTVERLDPPLAQRYATMLARLGALVASYTAPPPVLSHGALRTDQFLLADQQLVLIDLDSCCWANPARDLGNWWAYLRWKALRQPQHADLIAQAEPIFFASYQASRPHLDPRWLAFYQAAALLKIIGRRFQGLTWQEWPLLPPLFAVIDTLLAGG